MFCDLCVMQMVRFQLKSILVVFVFASDDDDKPAGIHNTSSSPLPKCVNVLKQYHSTLMSTLF